MVDVDIANKICNNPLPLVPQNDSRCWGPNANGKFSVKYATRIQNSANNDINSRDLLKRMWNLSLSHKIKKFNWLLMLCRLQIETAWLDMLTICLLFVHFVT